MNCPYKDCESSDILQLFIADGAKIISNLDGTVQTAYCKCLSCGKYFKHVSFCAPLGSTEKREAMAAELKAMSALRDYGLAAARAS